VLRWRAELAEVERQLDTLLAGYRKQLQISNLQYISLQVCRVGLRGEVGGIMCCFYSAPTALILRPSTPFLPPQPPPTLLPPSQLPVTPLCPLPAEPGGVPAGGAHRPREAGA